jgi:hypothetical protein
VLLKAIDLRLGLTQPLAAGLRDKRERAGLAMRAAALLSRSCER